jgi:hypothetical protein
MTARILAPQKTLTAKRASPSLSRKSLGAVYQWMEENEGDSIAYFYGSLCVAVSAHEDAVEDMMKRFPRNRHGRSVNVAWDEIDANSDRLYQLRDSVGRMILEHIVKREA